MSIAQNLPNTARLVYAQWHDNLFPAYYAEAQWFMYIPTGGTITMPPPQAWYERPAEWDATRIVAAPEPASGTDLAARVEAHDAELAQLNELIARLNQRITALEGAQATASPAAKELSVEEMWDAIDHWHDATGPRRVLFGSDGWYAADFGIRFAACGPETGDNAIHAAYRALQKGGQV